MEHNEYEAQAERFLKKFDLIIMVAFKGDKCPPWDDSKHIHGDRYRITIKRARLLEWKEAITKNHPTRKAISFDFWNSLRDHEEGDRPTSYDILACISSEATMPTTPDEVYEELGDMKPSQANRIAKFARKLQDFFSEPEIEELVEII